uniref:(northern house mosquito) hypothetical protein n=1 Tax=Culex pipiens TaxID=7175 RepID=A0A8D8DCP1_CULPI
MFGISMNLQLPRAFKFLRWTATAKELSLRLTTIHSKHLPPLARSPCTILHLFNLTLDDFNLRNDDPIVLTFVGDLFRRRFAEFILQVHVQQFDFVLFVLG